MDVLLKVASSIDDAIGLILGEDLPIPAEKYIGQYPYLNTYY